MIDNCSDMYLMNKMDVWYIKIKMRRRKEKEISSYCEHIDKMCGDNPKNVFYNFSRTKNIPLRSYRSKLHHN